MTLKETLQHKNLQRTKILETLNVLKEGFGWSQVDIQRRLGFKKNALSKLKSDENYFGSPQLLAAIGLLLELETLKKESAKIEQLRDAFREIAGQTGLNSTTPAPPHLDMPHTKYVIPRAKPERRTKKTE